jgi:hypothetical protein
MKYITAYASLKYALIDIRDSTAYNAAAKEKAAWALDFVFKAKDAGLSTSALISALTNLRDSGDYNDITRARAAMALDRYFAPMHEFQPGSKNPKCIESQYCTHCGFEGTHGSHVAVTKAALQKAGLI